MNFFHGSDAASFLILLVRLLKVGASDEILLQRQVPAFWLTHLS